MKDKSLKLYYSLLGVIILLFVISIMAVYSASFIVGIRRFNNSNYFIIRQVVSYVIGFSCFFIFMKIDYEKFRKYKNLIYIIGLILLISVLIPGIGKEVNGARRWIRLGPMSIQPAEYSKIFFVLALAGFLDFCKSKMRTGLDILGPALGMMLIYILLILKEKDMGTAVHIFIIASVMLYMTSVRFGGLITIYLIGILSAIPLIIYSQHRIHRVISYVEGMLKEGVGGGYQVRQSVIGIGNGGLFGLGYSNGRQKYFYLPELHTDFIFSVICEEGGFIAALFLVAIYIIIMVIGINAAKRAKDTFGKYVAIGITICVVSQAAINMFVASGLIPAKGIPLPFISYGGSSVISMMIMMGILANILKKGEEK